MHRGMGDRWTRDRLLRPAPAVIHIISAHHRRRILIRAGKIAVSLHVGLSAKHPDIPHQHILQRKRFLSDSNRNPVRASRFQSLQHTAELTGGGTSAHSPRHPLDLSAVSAAYTDFNLPSAGGALPGKRLFTDAVGIPADHHLFKKTCQNLHFPSCLRCF